jgi:hypothetical protein
MYGRVGFGSMGFGVALPIPFYELPTSAERTAALIRAVQKMIGTAETGVWDETTHNAIYQWWMDFERVNEPGTPPTFTSIPLYGSDPKFTMEALGGMLDQNSPEAFPTFQQLYTDLGIPMASWAVWSAFYSGDSPEANSYKYAIKSALIDVVVAESRAAGAASCAGGGTVALSSGKTMSTTAMIAIIAGVLIFGGIFGYGLGTSSATKAISAPAGA